MNLGRLEKLKEKLTSSKNLGDIATYFFDHFGENPAFMDLGRPTKNATLESFIATIGGQLCGSNKVVVSHLMLVQVPNTHFIHGGCFINGRMGNVIYFDDIEVGLLALVATKPGGNTLFSRFSCRKLPPEAVASDN